MNRKVATRKAPQPPAARAVELHEKEVGGDVGRVLNDVGNTQELFEVLAERVSELVQLYPRTHKGLSPFVLRAHAFLVHGAARECAELVRRLDCAAGQLELLASYQQRIENVHGGPDDGENES